MGKISALILMAVTAGVLGFTVISSGPVGASGSVNPKDRVTCADLGITIHDSAEGLNGVPDMTKMVMAGTHAHDAAIRRAARAIEADTSATANTAALKAIGTACSR